MQIPSIDFVRKHIKGRKKRKKSALLQKHGFEILNRVATALEAAGVTYFADFGTLLGFVRDGGFIKHDVDIDVGVLATGPADHETVRKKLTSQGFILWREYIFDGKVIEESYQYKVNYFKKIRFDINYYKSDDDFSRTYLFYRDSGQEYLQDEHSVVEMRYGAITSTKTIQVAGNVFRVPSNAESLLAEKYGPSWRIPDQKWIYWQSPAASILEKRGIHRDPAA